MPSNARVIVEYGPYSACGIVDHTTTRLEGLQNILEINGHKMELAQIEDQNAVKIYVNGDLIFDCDIRDLEFGGDGLLDPLCESALHKVNVAF